MKLFYGYQRKEKDLIGSVISVQPNKTFDKQNGGTYKATELKIMTEPSTFQGRVKPSEEKVQKIFTNHPLHATALQLQPGNRVELKMVKNGNFWDISSITVLGEAPTPNVDSSPQFANSSSLLPPAIPNNDDYERGKAIGTSMELVLEMYKSGGYFKKTATPAIVMDAVLAEAGRIVRFVKGEADLPINVMGEIQGEPEDEEIPL
jgi:hypothetical protein